ncbi:hypothetical protein DFH11DRAFT_1597089, partial [Phellopilus nigrolimitatus]
MHQCRICQKLFPRPSGLATHMNSHSGARRTSRSLFIRPQRYLILFFIFIFIRSHPLPPLKEKPTLTKKKCQ